MTRPRAFTSWLAPYFESFVALRRASGAGYVSQGNLLLAFDRYLDGQIPEPPLLREALIQYLKSLDRLSPRGLDNVVAVVWPAVAYALRHGARVETLPARPPKPAEYWRRRQPRILSLAEARRVLAAARRLPPVGSLRPATTAMLLGVLYTTGMRIGEALALDIGDLDCGDRILTVRVNSVKAGSCLCGSRPSKRWFATCTILRVRWARIRLPPFLFPACADVCPTLLGASPSTRRALQLESPSPCHDRTTFGTRSLWGASRRGTRKDGTSMLCFPR